MNAFTIPKNYSEVAECYNWGTILPLPAGQKFPPPSGYTGQSGVDPNRVTVATWKLSQGTNYALRLPDGVVGIDVDQYDAKGGAGTMGELLGQLGALPATVMSTSRGIESGSGIWFFRYPGGRLSGKAGTDIDVIQHTHRYAVVWPSVVEGRRYTWYDRDGEALTGPPALEDLAELPAAWVEHLRTGVSTYKTERAPRAKREKFESWLTGDDSPPCGATKATVKRWADNFERLTRGSHHDTMLAALHAITQTCGEGHSGYEWALDEMREAWADAVDGRYGEFERMVDGAASKAANDYEEGATDPCRLVRVGPSASLLRALGVAA